MKEFPKPPKKMFEQDEQNQEIRNEFVSWFVLVVNVVKLSLSVYFLVMFIKAMKRHDHHKALWLLFGMFCVSQPSRE